MKTFIAVFTKKLNGFVSFQQEDATSSVLVTVHLVRGKTSKVRAMHIHTFGDIRECSKCGGHWNPDNHTHGGRSTAKSHAGDLGNISFTRGIAATTFRTKKITLHGARSILGRSVIVHAGRDDLGRAGTDESASTGTAGARLECSVIGYMNRDV